MHTGDNWALIVLTAKIFADGLRREHGYGGRSRFTGARSEIEIDIAYVLAHIAAAFVVYLIGVAAALPIAILVRAGFLFGDRILIAANHSTLELIVLILALSLLDRPLALASAIQVITVSVWLYSVFQKLYHGQFHDGSFFYLMFQHPGTSDRWARLVPMVPRIEGFYGRADPVAQAFCRRFALLVLITESMVPLVALAMNGTIWSLLALIAINVVVGMVTRETNFMITNIVLSTFFLVPMSLSGLVAITEVPVALAIVVWCLVWPPLHAVMVRRLQLSPWKLAGWGMYATLLPRVGVIGLDGELSMPRTDSYYLLVVKTCGACTIAWLREYARQSFFRFSYKDPAAGIALLWYRKRGDNYITVCVAVPNYKGGEPVTFEISDERSLAGFRRYIASERFRHGAPLGADPSMTVGGRDASSALSA